MNSMSHPLSAEALEESADRLRLQIRTTVDDLRFNLAPRNLVSEIAGRTGVNDVTPREVFDSVAKRHPTTTVLVAAGVGIWAFFAMRSRGKIGTGTIGNTIGALGQSARTAFQRRAASKRDEFLRVADTHISAGAERLLDAVETAIGQQISQHSVTNSGVSVIEPAVRMLVFAVLEAIVTKVKK
jgi:hypothetical protein